MLLTLFYILAGLCHGKLPRTLRGPASALGKASFFQLLIVMPAVIGWAFLI